MANGNCGILLVEKELMTKKTKICKILIIGNIKITLGILKKLFKIKAKIVGVVESKNKKENSDYELLGPFCKKNKIPILSVSDINSFETFEWINNKNPDFIFCCGWSRLIKGALLRKYKNRIIGLHPSSLKDNRGRHPLIWPIILGLRKSAVSFFMINKFVDAGQIIDRKYFKLSSNENATTLYEKVQKIVLKRIPSIYKKISSNSFLKKIDKKRKNKKTEGNIWRKRNYYDGLIDWRMNADGVERLIKALTKPYVGAEFIYKNKIIKVWDAKALHSNKFKNFEYGRVLKVSKKSMVVKCLDQPIELKNFNPKIKVKTGEYLGDKVKI